MAIAPTSGLTFEDYLAAPPLGEDCFELMDGELIALPPESEPNHWIATALFLALMTLRTVPPRLIKTHQCELQVPVLQPGDAANRFPDLVILHPEHLALTQKRLTITLEMPPPRLIVEVVSPGKANRVRDYERKLAQYAAIAVPEYWLIDAKEEQVVVLQWVHEQVSGVAQLGYQTVGRFKGDDRILSPELGTLPLTATQILSGDFLQS
ncbi:MAG: Uma2 family endonuclease [Synechococcales bacterium]|nr:Uma2 family endonuclease [Synechococcales bacterium]